MGSAVIHAKPEIAWQAKRGAFFMEGFRRAGIPCQITDSPSRLDDGIPVLLGTTFWRAIERSGPYLLVDRCSFGDTTVFVSLVWNGHGRRGDHKIPDRVDASRWESMGGKLLPWRKSFERIVLCGQTETYSPKYPKPQDWYRDVPATHYRPHPAESGLNTHDAKVGLIENDFENALAVTLNSSIGVKCVMEGIPTITMDEGSMAWDVTGHSLEDIRMPEREEWANRLAWTQWSDDEIKEGKPWAYHWS